MSKKKIRWKPKPNRQLSPAKREEMKVINKRNAEEAKLRHAELQEYLHDIHIDAMRGRIRAQFP